MIAAVHEETSVLEIVTFRVGELFVGIDIRQVEEINRFVEVTSIPQAPDYVLGVLNLRGNVVTVLDLRKMLGLKTPPADRRSRNVIVQDDGERVGLLVDSVADVLTIATRDIDPIPSNFDAIDARYLIGVCVLENELLLLLNIKTTLAIQDRKGQAK